MVLSEEMVAAAGDEKVSETDEEGNKIDLDIADLQAAHAHLDDQVAKAQRELKKLPLPIAMKQIDQQIIDAEKALNS